MNARRFTALFVIAAAAPLAAAEPIPITGEVVSGGKPVAGATARLSRLLPTVEAARLRLAGKELPAPAAAATSDAAGRFVLAAPGAGMWRVEVDAPGFAREEIALAPLTAPRLLPPVELNQAGEVAVTVVDAEGKPVAGAEVEATFDQARFVGPWEGAEPAWTPSAQRAATGADGRAVLTLGRRWRAQVRASAPGRAAVESPLRDGAVKLQLAAGCPQAVEVFAGAKPVAGAVVSYMGGAAGLSPASGSLEVTVACQGPIALGVAGDGGAAATVSADARRDAPLRAELTPRRRLQGRVRDGHTGRPIAGALIWPEGEPAGYVVTEADGVYRALVPAADRPRLHAAAQGYLTTAKATATSGPEPLPGPEIALTPALMLSGTAADEEGRGVPGVRLAASLASQDPSAMMLRTFRSGLDALTDDKGRFSLQVSAGLEYRVEARHPDFAPADVAVPPLPPGEVPPPLRLVLTPGTTASGKVLGPEGKPVAKAMVFLTRAEPDRRPGRRWLLDSLEQSPEAVTDAGGRFQFERLAPGRYDLSAKAPGLAPTTVRGLTLPDKPRRFDLGTVVLRPGEALRGKVTDREGAPLAGVTVSLDGMDFESGSLDRTDADAVTTDAEGAFAFTGLAPGFASLSAEKEGYGPAVLPLIPVPATAPLEVTLDRLLTLLCRVVDERGTPLAGASVYARSSAGWGFGLPAETETDAQGEATLEIPGAGRWELTAEASGMLATTRVVEVAGQEPAEPVTLTLARGAVLVGRVEGPDGSPLPEATVRQVDPSEEAWFVGRNSGSTADGNGAYRLEGLSTGPQSFDAFRRGFRRQVRDLDVRPGENRLDFRLEPGVEVSGRVVDREGAPVSGAAVSLQGSSDYPGQVVSTAEGSFVLPGVSAGTYQLLVHKSGFSARRIDGIHVAAAPVTGLEVRLLPAGAIRGRILGLDFAALSTVQVMASSTSEMARAATASVDFEGNYRLDDLAPGDWTVLAMAGTRLQQARAVVEAGAETVLDLELAADGYRLSGRVLAGGGPAAGAILMLASSAGGGFATSGSDGSFQFESLRAGTYELRVQGMGVQTISHRRTLEIQGDTELTIDLGNARVSGLVLDAAGDPVAGAQITLSPQGTGDADHASSRSDAEGRFAFAGAGPGPHLLQASKEGYSAAEVALDLPEGGDLDGLRMTLTPAASLILHVVGPAGVAPEWVGVALLDAAGRAVGAGTYSPGENGRIDVQSAPPGRYRLLVGGLNTATISLDAVVPGGPLRIGLPAESTIKVRVVPLAGAVFGGRLSVLDAAGQTFQAVGGGAVTASWDLFQGIATVSRLGAGTWTLVVTAPDGKAWQRQVTVGPGENAEVVIE